MSRKSTSTKHSTTTFVENFTFSDVKAGCHVLNKFNE